MPVLKYDYDYEEYINSRRRASVPTRTRASVNVATRTTTTNRNVVAKRKPQSNSTTKTRRPQISRSVTIEKKQVKRKVQKQLDVPKIKPKEMSLTKPKTVARTKANVKIHLSNIVLVVMMFSIFFMICYRYSKINEKFQGIQKIKSEIEVSRALNGQLEAEIASKTDLSYIENYAKYQLGMQKPSNSQIRRITLEKEDKIIAPVSIDETTEESVLVKILKEIRKILD